MIPLPVDTTSSNHGLTFTGAGVQSSRAIAFLAWVTDSSEAGPPGFSVASAWLRSTKGRIRSS